MKQPQKSVQMCCVTLGYTNYVMPADKGMKVVALMQSAVSCSEEYEDQQWIYRTDEEPKAVEFKLIQQGQLRGPMAPASPRQTRQIGHVPPMLGRSE